jgi:hypothetical protein
LKLEFDTPGGGAAGRFTPDESWGGDFGREDGPILGIFDPHFLGRLEDQCGRAGAKQQ